MRFQGNGKLRGVLFMPTVIRLITHLCGTYIDRDLEILVFGFSGAWQQQTGLVIIMLLHIILGFHMYSHVGMLTIAGPEQILHLRGFVVGFP